MLHLLLNRSRKALCDFAVHDIGCIKYRYLTEKEVYFRKI